MKRKEFIQSLFRFSILVMMGALIGIFLRKGKITSSQECDVGFQCRNCNKLKNCSLEEANTYKSNG